MATRRQFFKLGLMGTLFLFSYSDGEYRVVSAEIPGGSLSPDDIPRYQTPLLIPPVMPAAGTIRVSGGMNIDYYEISMKQLSQQILPPPLPATTVWGYGAAGSTIPRGLLLHNAPSLTIEATWNRPVRIRWINDLKDANGHFRPHLLPVDQTLHWANPPGGIDHRDSEPDFSTTPGPYTGPVPMVTHLHGASQVGDESDGYAEAWYLPAATNIPTSHATVGTWYDFFESKAAGLDYLNPSRPPSETGWEPGTAVFQYPNSQRAATLWYHDHTLGMTRLNVYAGPAGFYLIRGGPDGDDAVLDSRTRIPAILPGPAPKRNDKFPPNKTYYEIPIAIQDRAFNTNGSLFYPSTRAFFDTISGPYIPDSDISPLWNPEFFGNCMMVNGNTWPYLNVERRRYRFRFLNGCNSRFLILDFGAIPGVEVWQIGNEGGFLSDPVNHSAPNSNNRILMGPAERADVIVDFTTVPPGTYELGNIGPDEPFGGGEPGIDFEKADPASTGRVMQFRVGPALTPDVTTPPKYLVLPPVTPLVGGTPRRLALLEELSQFFADAPAETLLGTVSGDPTIAPAAWSALDWDAPITENPTVGTTEIWEIYNGSADAHPMHIHEALFQVINRQPVVVNETSKTFRIMPGSVPRPPESWETGWKDTVIVYPGEVTRLRIKFEVPGQFVWHCHIVEHEDNEMMRPYRIGPVQSGQPT